MTFSAKAPEVNKYVGHGPFWPYRADPRDPKYHHVDKYNNDHLEKERVARVGAYWLAKELGYPVDPPVTQGAGRLRRLLQAVRTLVLTSGLWIRAADST